MYLNEHSERTLGRLSRVKALYSVNPQQREKYSDHVVLCTGTETCLPAAGVRVPARVLDAQGTPTLTASAIYFRLGFCALFVDVYSKAKPADPTSRNKHKWALHEQGSAIARRVTSAVGRAAPA